MSVDKYVKERRDEELRHKEETEALKETRLEEANLDGADEIYGEPDRFESFDNSLADSNNEVDNTEPATSSDEYDIDTDFERTLL